jgi:hypothetical protein
VSDEERRRRIEAATAVFERVLRGGAEPRAAGPTRPERIRLAQLRTAAARTIDLYGQLLQNALEAYTDLSQGALQPAAAPPVDAALALEGRAGADVVASLWVHNLTETAVSAELQLTPLVAPGGAHIAGGAFWPRPLDVPPGVSGEALLTLSVPSGAAPGVYHGHVLAPTLPESGLAVRLTVRR